MVLLSLIPDIWEWVHHKAIQLVLDKMKPLGTNSETKLRGLLLSYCFLSAFDYLSIFHPYIWAHVYIYYILYILYISIPLLQILFKDICKHSASNCSQGQACFPIWETAFPPGVKSRYPYYPAQQRWYCPLSKRRARLAYLHQLWVLIWRVLSCNSAAHMSICLYYIDPIGPKGKENWHNQADSCTACYACHNEVLCLWQRTVLYLAAVHRSH